MLVVPLMIMMCIYLMQEQVIASRVLTSFPPIEQLVRRYNSVSTTLSKQGPEMYKYQKTPSFLTKQSSSSFKSLNRQKMYISKSPSFFKKMQPAGTGKEEGKLNSSGQRSIKQIRRLVDRQYAVDAFLKHGEAKINHRFLERQEDRLRTTNYDEFFPYKKSHEFNRKVQKVQFPSHQVKAHQNIQKK